MGKTKDIHTVDITIKERAEEEQKRILRIMKEAGLSDKRIKMLEPVVLNTAWMKAELDSAREAIKDSNIVIEYDNGGGQKGVRENPLFKGYESLWKAYMNGLDRIMANMPEDIVKLETEEAQKPKTMLELVRSKHIKEA